jgi:hypothetical protein
MDDLDDLDDLGAEDGNCMKTEACAHESTAGGGAKLEEIPRRCAPRNAPFPVSFRTDVRNLQLGMMNAFGMDDLDNLDDLGAEDGNCMKTEACAHESTAGGGAKLEEIPRRCAPRNAPFPVSFRTQ